MTLTKNEAHAVRASIRNAIDARIAFEETVSGGNKTIKQLTGFLGKSDRLDFDCLAYSASIGFNWDSFINSHKMSGVRCNIYSIPKAWELMTVLHGRKFSGMTENDPATITATLAALAEGVSNQTLLANRVSSLLTGIRRFQFLNGLAFPTRLADWQEKKQAYSYNSGGTQSGSSLRALEALGIVSEKKERDGNCKLWGFTNPDSEATRELVRKAFDALSLNMFADSASCEIPKTPSAPKLPEAWGGEVSAPVVPETSATLPADEKTASPDVSAPVVEAPAPETEKETSLLDAMLSTLETPAKKAPAKKATRKASPAKTAKKTVSK